MIVLDTNQLDRHSFDSSYMAILKILAHLTNNKLALSEVTYNEHCAHYENQLRRLYAQEEKARREISDLVKPLGDWRVSSRVPSERVNESATKDRQSYEKKILEIFELITLDGASAVEALRREAWRIPPASTSFDVKGSGARDAAIWLSLANESVKLSEVIFFVSSDKQAFRAPAINADLADTGARIIVVEDMGELLKILADEVGIAVDTDLIGTSEIIKRKVLDYIGSVTFHHEFMDAARHFSVEHSSCRYGDQGFRGIEFLGAHDLHGHVIADERWVTVRARWLISYSIECDYKRHAAETEWIVVPDELWEITFQVSSLLIFQEISGCIEKVEVLNVGRPSQVTNLITRLG
jgi:hypothetical protein